MGELWRGELRVAHGRCAGGIRVGKKSGETGAANKSKEVSLLILNSKEVLWIICKIRRKRSWVLSDYGRKLRKCLKLYVK